MKKHLVLLAFCLFTFHFKAQVRNHACDSIDNIVETIEKGLPDLVVREKSNISNGYSRSYFKEGKLQAIMIQGTDDQAKKNVAWFFSDDKLIYTETKWFDKSSGKELFCEKTYHLNNKLISWYDRKGEFVDPFSSNFRFVDSSLSAYGNKLVSNAYK